jgi:hypothetical protein
MSMWCSARSDPWRITAAVVAVCAALTAGCDRIPFLNQGGETRPEQARSVDQRPGDAARVVTPPGRMRSLWTVADDATAQVVGRLRLNVHDSVPGEGQPISLAFANGVTVRLNLVTIFAPQDPSGAGGASFAGLLSADPATDVFVYRVQDELIGSSARGGLCGTIPTRHVAIAEYSEADGARVLRIIAFHGEPAPGSLTGDPGFCRVLRFEAR